MGIIKSVSKQRGGEEGENEEKKEGISGEKTTSKRERKRDKERGRAVADSWESRLEEPKGQKCTRLSRKDNCRGAVPG